jgi:hypothetical protein
VLPEIQFLRAGGYIGDRVPGGGLSAHFFRQMRHRRRRALAQQMISTYAPRPRLPSFVYTERRFRSTAWAAPA